MVARIKMPSAATSTGDVGNRGGIRAFGVLLNEMSAKKLNLRRSALEHHKQIGKELIPPFQQIGPSMEQIFWLRDLLPEFLWIDALVHDHGQPAANRILNDFLTDADRFNSHPKEILDGTIGAFRFIAEGDRRAFVEELAVKIAGAVARPLRHILSLYPDCPMKWMAHDQSAEDRDSSIAAVRDAVGRLFAGKEPHAGFCRALPLNRFFAHNKLCISSDLTDTIEAIKNYPHGDKYRAETFARTTHNMALVHRAKEDPDTFAWARSFWNSNRTIVPCVL